ncbi:MAG: hypothetical protein GWN62_07425, partial [Aliifodinibius sp.]|nr:hypothetical protein [Fodinibius sp.]
MKSLSKNILKDLRFQTFDAISLWYSAEVPLFGELWKLFEAANEKNQDSLGLGDFRICADEGTLIAELGFSSGQILELVTPRVLAALYGAIFDATKMPGEIPPGYISKVVREQGKYFNVPESFWPELEQLVSKTVKADFEQSGVFPVGDRGHNDITLFRWDDEVRTGDRSELKDDLEQIRSCKETVELFLDDLRNEFLVFNKPKNLPYLQRRLLMQLLIRVGDYWEYADLFSRIWGDEMADAN